LSDFICVKGNILYLCIMKTQTSPNMSKRHIAQIIRRMTIQRVKPSGKVYKRTNNKKIDD
jgi:hypothetical protein